MPVIQPYFRPYTDKRTSMFAAAWMSFVGTRSELNMMAIKQQMNLMDPSIINQQIVRAQQNILELQKLKISVSQKSNSERSRWLGKQLGGDDKGLAAEVKYEQELGKRSSPTSAEEREADKISNAVEVFDLQWSTLGSEIDSIILAGGAAEAMYANALNKTYEASGLGKHPDTRKYLSALLAAKVEELKPGVNRNRLLLLLNEQADAAGKTGAAARTHYEKKAAEVKKVPVVTIEQEDKKILQLAQALGVEIQDGNIVQNLSQEITPDQNTQIEALQARLTHHEKQKALIKQKGEGGSAQGLGTMPSKFDPADLNLLIKQEEDSLKALRQRQSRMIEKGPGAIFSPFQRSLIKETPFTYSPTGFQQVQRGKVYKTSEDRLVGITKSGEPFYFTDDGTEIQPTPGTEEYENVVEMLRSLP